jgi:glycosyltransferase involved in cell wall biosynthesis
MLVAVDDAENVDWTSQPNWRSTPLAVVSESVEIAWIMSPPGAESGGHQNLFRFIKFAEDHGHFSRIYLYDQFGHSLSEVRAMLAASEAYPHLQATIEDYRPEIGVAPSTQALFASGWETAYPAFRDPSLARRFYFVQDFEPSFYPVGTESLLAENTYRFGFHGITAGGWLSHKLQSDYGMVADHFDFSVDASLYNLTNHERRNEIFFYARPVTTRRAFEFGLLSLAKFAERRPEVTINFAGWDVRGWEVPFAYRNLASMELSKLNQVYNRCAAGLVLSLTNMSLLPLELLACGTAAVVNDAPNNRMVSDNPFIHYVPPSPVAIADRLEQILDAPDAIAHSVARSKSVAGSTWADSGAQFVASFERVMRG